MLKNNKIKLSCNLGLTKPFCMCTFLCTNLLPLWWSSINKEHTDIYLFLFIYFLLFWLVFLVFEISNQNSGTRELSFRRELLLFFCIPFC